MEADKSDVIDVTPEKDGGVIKEIKRPGEGTETPYLGDDVTVHYVGTLTDGTQFDSSRDRGDKFQFNIGKGNVIKAWDLAVASMKKGELAVLTCKPEYAYGENGSPPKIGKNATLIFEVELFDWKGEDVSENKDGSVVRHQIKMGEGYQTPNEGATVNIHLVGRCQGNIFEERDVEFILGEGEKEGIVTEIDQALLKFKKGEHSKLEVKGSAGGGYGEKGNQEFGIPPDSDLEYEVILNQFEKAKESWEMDGKEKLEQSEIVKGKGTALFKKEQYEQAITQYKKVVSYLEDESTFKDEMDMTSRNSLLLAAYLNISMCHLKLGEYMETKENCEKALDIDHKNTKALYRRAQAYDKVNEHNLAIKDYESLLTIEPENKAAKNQLTLVRNKLKKFVADQKKRYQGMFTKFAAQDEKNKKGDDHGDTNIHQDEEIEQESKIEANGDVASSLGDEEEAAIST